MSTKKGFERELSRLWTIRIDRLMRRLTPRRGKPKQFSKAVREKAIARLEELATSILLKSKVFRRAFHNARHRTTWRQIVGRGHAARFAGLALWIDRLHRGPVVYSFWKGRRCLYVGKGKSTARLFHYQKSIYMQEATRLRVDETSRRDLARLECLATHLWAPRDNKVKAASQRWGSDCPVCTTHDEIRSELRAVFAVK